MTPPIRTVVVTLLAALTVLSGCSDPSDPAPAPAPASGASSSAPTSTASAAPSAAPTSSASASTAPQPSSTGSRAVDPSRPVETAAPRRTDESGRVAGAEVSLVSLEATTITAQSEADRSGPGVLVRVEIRNTGEKRLDTSFVQVGVTSSAGAAGTLVGGRPTRPLGSSVGAGDRAEGTYAFVLDGAAAGPVTVLVYVTSGQPVLQFRGRAS